MTEYVKKSDVLELLSLPKDLIAEYVCNLKGLWIDDDEAEQTEPTISKMEQVEDEPQSNADQRIQNVESVEPTQTKRRE